MPVDLASQAGVDLVRRVGGMHGAFVAAMAAIPMRLFLLRSPLAPGLRFVGSLAEDGRAGTADVFSQSGTGDAIEDAFAACLGETVERLSQIERPGDVALSTGIADVAHRVLPSVAALASRVADANGAREGVTVDWVEARRLGSGDVTLVPADWCLRRATDGPLRIAGSALSTGAAASPDPAVATLAALCELIERDAVALWWAGGRRPRPWASEGPALQAGAAMLARLRQGVQTRATLLLDITSDLGVPCVAAVSVDADGRNLACGFAANLDGAVAARKAVLEMCQMEVSNLLIAAKLQEYGAEGLDPFEKRTLEREDAIDFRKCELLHPSGLPRSAAAYEPLTAGVGVDRLAEIFDRHGIDATLVQFTRPDYGFTVVGAIAPQLQQFPSDVEVGRLQASIRATGGGARWTSGAALL